MRTMRCLMLACAALAAAWLAGCAEAPQRREAAAKDLVFPAPPDAPRFYFERSIYASGDIVAKDKTSTLRQMLTGEGERMGEGVQKPSGVAAREGRVYVADSVGGSVKVFDIPGRSFHSVGSDGQGALYQPLGIDVDAAHNLYAVDARSGAVKIYDRAGKFLRQLGGPKMFARPSGVGVTSDGERVYVVDTGGVERREEHRVRVFSGKSGEHLFDFGTRGSGDGQFNLARGVAVAPDGRVYVVDTGNFRVQAFDRDGKFLKAFGGVGRQPGNFARPRSIAIDGEGRVYVSDAAFGNFQIFDAEGQLLMHVGERSEQDRPARYMLPSGIAVDRDGRVYMADEFFRRIDVFRPAALKPNEGYAAGSAAAAKDAKAGDKPK